MINKTIPVKEEEKHVYTKDLKSIVEDFNNYFTSVGKITAAKAMDRVNKNNIALSDSMLNSKIYPTDQQFSIKPVKLCSYIAENQLLSPHRNGNRKHHSTETLNIFITDKMLEAMDKKHITALILLDLCKAFDRINHTFLLHKLKRVGASPLDIQWFESYRTLSHGVPHDSILSPLLFGIYVNDLPAVTVSTDFDFYLDDSKLHLAFLVEDVQQTIAKLENNLYKIAEWCLEHQLLINPDKTKFLLLGTKSMLQNLPTQNNLKFLEKTLKP
ncbi:Hypothetical predicted protein, partial [Paramuricea clavata]